MSNRFAIVTIEMPLDGGDLEDAKILAGLIGSRTLTTDQSMIGRATALDRCKLYGQVINVQIEDRVGKGRAQS
jgi:hypothetical protein